MIKLDAGHGSVNKKGEYTTAPSKMVRLRSNPAPDSELIHEKNGKFEFYEGEFNRKITEGVAKSLAELNVPFIRTYGEYDDTPLRRRVLVERLISSFTTKKSLLISTHANAGRGKGIEVFTSRGQTYSDQVATYFLYVLEMLLTDSGYSIPMRTDYFSDGDADKEADFYVLKESYESAILIEYGFMDSTDIEFLCDPVVQDIFIQAQVITCLWFESETTEGTMLSTTALVEMPPLPKSAQP